MDKKVYDQVWEWFSRLKMDHMRDRDGSNNYGCFNVEGCTGCNYVYNSRNCNSCHNCDACQECVSCVDCKNCAFCVGLKEASFQILNVQYAERDYFAKLKELGIDPEVNAF